MKRAKKADRDPSTGRFKPGHKFAWKPGQSGNPSGISKADVRKMAEEFGNHFDPKMGKTRDEHFLALMYRLGCQGNMTEEEMHARLAELWERVAAKGGIQ